MFTLPPCPEFDKDPVRNHENLAKSGQGDNFVGIVLTTCKNGIVDVKASTYNTEQDCNYYSQSQLSVLG